MRYEFLVRGRLSDGTCDAFPELAAAEGPLGGTSLYGPVRDDAELHGLLARFAQMGLQVVEMRRLPD
jgi:hypothetical protein